VDGKFLALGDRRQRLQGVTYGPFRPNGRGEPCPAPSRVAQDFAQMRQSGVNAVRTYCTPPEWLLSMADEAGVSVLMDIPWAKHVCFLSDRDACRQAHAAVREAARLGNAHPSAAAYSIGNEIPTDVVRWHGERRVERFLAELADEVRQADPDGLVTYASFPPTEYLELPFIDFVTFNVYLHDLDAFARYLPRLQNLAGDKPLVLGELGMDSLREGESAQADFLAGHLREAVLSGVAGTFVFSWTDEWFTGGHAIEDWAFGVTRADRSPKPALEALRRVYGRRPSELLDHAPAVSVVVCSYNGGSTLEQCLTSLREADYPDREVILVDDGSTDSTREIVSRFPEVRAIHQPNRGLSVARNVGLQAATGEVVAYTDSDCLADPDWLTLLVHRLQSSEAAAVGGPNLSPEDGRVAACVDASPGQPTHVLEDDQVAEHIPGCNMAFRREALEAIGGFDPVYRQAGDDVDVCWRLQANGGWIAFAPSAFVWHHRRQTAQAYLRQQFGYGRAEALLRLNHPDRFNRRGDGKWRGTLYGGGGTGLRVGRQVIIRGRFATGLFQAVYNEGGCHWAVLPGTLEWQAAAGLALAAGFLWAPAWALAAGLLALSGGVVVLRAAQARLPSRHDGLVSRALVAGLSYLQPLVRAWGRYATKLRMYRPPGASDAAGAERPTVRVPLSGGATVEYWTQMWRDRSEVLDRFVVELAEAGWVRTVDPVQATWDVLVHCDRWTATQTRTVQEDHGSGRRLLRVRHRVRPTVLGWAVSLVAVVALMAGALLPSPLAALYGAALLVGGALCWWHGTRVAGRVADAFTRAAAELGFALCRAAGEGCPGPAAGASNPARAVEPPLDALRPLAHPGSAPTGLRVRRPRPTRAAHRLAARAQERRDAKARTRGALHRP
jgi:GT2 family glycosyltransferase